MHKVWFTSDPHLGHKRIIELCNRPFSSLEEMDNMIIHNWNSIVSPDDEIYCLGDFAFTDHTPYLLRLNGIKHLILGNHDHSKRIKKAEGWETISKFEEIEVGDDRVVLFHYKMATWHRSSKGTFHLYGHSHGNWPGDSQCCDVGVDCWGFKPVSLAQAKERMKTFPKRVEVDHHKPSDE